MSVHRHESQILSHTFKGAMRPRQRRPPGFSDWFSRKSECPGGRERVTRDHDSIAAEDFKPKFLAKTTMAKKAADASIGAAKRALLEMAVKHGRVVHLVNPAYTTMDCSAWETRAKTCLLLSERTFTCGACGAVLPRDKNSAAVMLVRAGLNPAGADRARRAAA
jgi:putative transposase